jgi:hypothetical protein
LWVESFAQELRKAGIDARLDAWRDESQSIDDFMMIELERADFVVAICTPTFKQKIMQNAEGAATASGFEIGTAAALRRMAGKDVIPVLRSGEWTSSAPSGLLSYRFYDFTKADVSGEFTQLRDRLLGHARRPPPLGHPVNPAEAPELPDIFAEGAEPEPVPESKAPAGRASAPRPSAAAVAPPAPNPTKGRPWAWAAGGALAIIVLGYFVADMDLEDTADPGVGVIIGEAPGNEAPVGLTLEEALSQGWQLMSSDDACFIQKQIANRSWAQMGFNGGLFQLGVYDPAWGEVELFADYEVVYSLNDEEDQSFLVDAKGHSFDQVPGVYISSGSADFIRDITEADTVSFYEPDESGEDVFVMEFDLAGASAGVKRLLQCVSELY